MYFQNVNLFKILKNYHKYHGTINKKIAKNKWLWDLNLNQNSGKFLHSRFTGIGVGIDIHQYRQAKI